MSIQPADPDAFERVPLDMDHITRQALGLRRWRLEFECDGALFVWHGDAANMSAAESMARTELAEESAGFNRIAARLVAFLEQ